MEEAAVIFSLSKPVEEKQTLCVSPNISKNATYSLPVMPLSLTHVLEGIESG